MKNKNIDLKKETELKIKVIELLIENDETDFVICYRNFIEKLNTTKKELKPIIENLKSLGMIEVVKAFDDDGFMRGSGYVLTKRATQWSIREWLLELKSINI